MLCFQYVFYVKKPPIFVSVMFWKKLFNQKPFNRYQTQVIHASTKVTPYALFRAVALNPSAKIKVLDTQWALVFNRSQGVQQAFKTGTHTLTAQTIGAELVNVLLIEQGGGFRANVAFNDWSGEIILTIVEAKSFVEYLLVHLPAQLTKLQNPAHTQHGLEAKDSEYALIKQVINQNLTQHIEEIVTQQGIRDDEIAHQLNTFATFLKDSLSHNLASWGLVVTHLSLAPQERSNKHTTADLPTPKLSSKFSSEPSPAVAPISSIRDSALQDNPTAAHEIPDASKDETASEHNEPLSESVADKQEETMEAPKIYYYMRSGERIGPLSVLELQQAAIQGKFGARTLVWQQNMPGWQEASSIAELKICFTQRSSHS